MSSSRSPMTSSPAPSRKPNATRCSRNRSAAQHRRKRAIDLYTRAKLSDDEFDAIAADVEQELKTLDDRLAGLEPADDPLDDAVSADVLAEIRERLDGGPLGRRATGDRSAARAPDHRPHHSSPTAAASRSASLSTTASRE